RTHRVPPKRGLGGSGQTSDDLLPPVADPPHPHTALPVRPGEALEGVVEVSEEVVLLRFFPLQNAFRIPQDQGGPGFRAPLRRVANPRRRPDRLERLEPLADAPARTLGTRPGDQRLKQLLPGVCEGDLFLREGIALLFLLAERDRLRIRGA